MVMLARCAVAISWLIVGVGLLQALLQLLQLGLAMFVLLARRDDPAPHLWRRLSASAPAVTILSPAYNEAVTIVESVRSLLNLAYPAYEVVVINDGSTDATLQTLIETFDLTLIARAHEGGLASEPIRGVYGARHQPRLVVIDKANGGKADALNAGLNVAREPLVCVIDSDSLLEPDALLRTAQPFIDDPDRMIAVGGTVRIANGCTIAHGRIVKMGLPRNVLALLQTLEDLRAFLIARLAWSQMGALTIISGAFGVFLRDAVIEVGGYRRDAEGEDMDLVIKLHRRQRDLGRDYRIAYVPEPVCWTEAPESFAVLARQRQRWQRGAMEAFTNHGDMLVKSGYGRIAALGMTNVLLTDVLGPALEILGYGLIPVLCLLDVLSISYLEAFLAVSIGFGIAISVGALALEESQLKRVASVSDLLLMLAAAMIENLGYRQLNNFWRAIGTWQYMRGKKSWGVMTRKGFGSVAVGPSTDL